jgi:hypothetical protein
LNKVRQKRKAATELGTDESTMRKRLNTGSGVTALGHYKPVFTKTQESELAEYCKDLDDRFYALTLQTLRKLGYEFGEANNVKYPFDKLRKTGGKDWAYRFVKTHNLSLRTPQQTSLERVMGFNTVQVNKFFQNLTELYQKYKFPPSAILNMDESGLSTVPNKVRKVATAKGKKVVGKVSSGERGENINFVCAMSASGFYCMFAS